jgi:hypothetical protein
MQDVIENGTVEVGDRIADIISATQILKANVDAVGELSLPAGVAPRVEDIRFYIARAAEIYARGSAMFSFARNESEDPPPRHPTPQDMTVALNLMGFPDFNYPDLHTLAVNKATSWD